MFTNNFCFACVMQTLAKVVSSALRIYLHMAFLMREGGFKQRAKQRSFEKIV